MKTFGLLLLLLISIPPEVGLCAERPAGRVVWWGTSYDHQARDYTTGRDYTNGVLECDGEALTNVVAIAARDWQALALKSDGTVFAVGSDRLGRPPSPAGLSNVVSIAIEGDFCWAIKRDGTVARWGGEIDAVPNVAGLSNISMIAWAGGWNYLALKNDGTVLGFKVQSDPAPVRSVSVRGVTLSNVVSIALSGYFPLILKSDGTVLELGFQSPGETWRDPVVSASVTNGGIILYLRGEVSQLPYQYTTANPIIVDGEPLTNVVALATEGLQQLALKKDGTVVAWDANDQFHIPKPPQLDNITAIASVGQQSFALKRDGTVAAWRASPVPAGLSNVVAIAAGGFMTLAITTGTVPSSVEIVPHSRLEYLTQKADFIFKGQALSSVPLTNSALYSDLSPHATRFKIISVFKGNAGTTNIVFYHYTNQPHAWGGGSPPPSYQFEAGQSYLVFAANLAKPDTYYTPSLDHVGRPGEFRQMAGGAPREDDGATRTLDDRPSSTLSIKDAHWSELNLLLKDSHPINRLYAVKHLNSMTKPCVDRREWWSYNGDFKQERVFNVLRTSLADPDDQVAVAAINCFQAGSECATQIAVYADALIEIATASPSALRRAAAVAAFQGTKIPIATNSLARWLNDPDEQVRVPTVRLLFDFPGEFAERALRQRANDPSALVRSAVAEVIGRGKIQTLLPSLAKLFAEPIDPQNSISPELNDNLSSGAGGDYVRDLHASAGVALLQFELEQVEPILKTNLNDAGFRLQFLCKLAAPNPKPWLDDMVQLMEDRRKRDEKKASGWGQDPTTYKPAITGAEFVCWSIVYDYLHGLAPNEFAEGKQDRYLNMLEKAGANGANEPLKLYELYRLKGLDQRAWGVRENYKREIQIYGAGRLEKIDAQYTNQLAPPKSSP